MLFSQAVSAEERRRRRGQLRGLEKQAAESRAAAAQRRRDAARLERARGARREWRERWDEAEARVAPFGAEEEAVRGLMKREGSVSMNLQGEHARLQQLLSVAGAQQRELAEQKQIAVGARNFKEAGRISAALKALVAEEAEHKEGAQRASAQIEAAKGRARCNDESLISLLTLSNHQVT